MPNPIVSENNPQVQYTVQGSSRAHAALSLDPAVGQADFSITWTPAAVISGSLQRGGDPPIPLTIPTTADQTVAVGSLSVTYRTLPPGATPEELQVEVVDPTASSPPSSWTVRLWGIPAGSTAVVLAGNNAAITLVEADVFVEVLPFSPAAPKENQVVTLQAKARRNSIPLPAAASCAGTVLVWSQAPGDPVSGAPGATTQTPTTFIGPTAGGCQGQATVTLPGLTSATTFNYVFTATIGEFSNTGAVAVPVTTRNRHTVLVLDRSGSMAAENRWNNAVKAAHIWLDLLVAYRGASADDRVGILIFEDAACGWRAAGMPDPSIRIEFPTLNVMSAYPTAATLGNPLAFGSPGSCTPIGDGLIKALDSMTTGLPGNAADNLYCVLLLTDGWENSGLVKVDNDTSTPAGVELFNAIKSSGARSIFVFSGLSANAKLYAIGLGAMNAVQDSVLEELASTDIPMPGYYRNILQPADLVQGFGEMLNHSIGAMRQPASATPPVGPAESPAPAGTIGYFAVPSGEAKLVVAMPWAAITDQIELMWRPQSTAAAAFQAAPGPAIDIRPRASHVVAVVELPQVSSGATEWRLRYTPASPSAPTPTPASILATRDLRVRSEILFDRRQYRTGDPVRITARLRAGGAPITDARVVLELARPGQSLGTLLVNHARRYQPSQPTGPDPAHPKQAMIRSALRAGDLPSFPVITPPSIFIDGTNELWDDGGHADGAGKDGDYANTYGKADAEGTYTFRFLISGRTPDGSFFEDTITISKWIGLTVDPGASSVRIDPRVVAGQPGLVVSVLPRSRNDQFLGPFWPSEVEFRTTAGTFLPIAQLRRLWQASPGEFYEMPDGAGTISQYDGHYSRILVHRRDEKPVISVRVQGKEVSGRRSAAQECAQSFLRLLAAVLRLPFAWFRR